MTEAEFQRQAEAECARLGLLWHHCTDSRHCRGPRGFPDLLALGPGGLVIAELKGTGGETTAGQDLWIWTASAAGLVMPVYCPEGKADLTSALRQIG